MNLKLEPLQCLTTAIHDYDWRWTKKIADNLFTDERGKKYRLVQVEDQYHFEMQIGRYYSGNDAVITQQTELDGLLKNGLLTPTKNPTRYYRAEFNLTKLAQPTNGVMLEEYFEMFERMRLNKKIKFEPRNEGCLYDLEVADETSELFDQLKARLKSFE